MPSWVKGQPCVITAQDTEGKGLSKINYRFMVKREKNVPDVE